MSNLVARVQNILMTPKTEWPVIAAEPETTSGLYTRYILIVSALGPIAMFLKGTLIGTSTFLGTFRMDMGTGLKWAVLVYAIGLIGIYLWSLIINALAPTFGAQKDSVQALKTAAYAATAAWVGGVAQLIPWIGWLVGLAAAVYSIYLLYLGLPHTMKAPADRAGAYTAVTIIVAIVLSWILWSIIGSVMGRGLMGGYGGPAATVGDTGFEKGSTGAALEEWAKNMEKAGKQVESVRRAERGRAIGCRGRRAHRRRGRGPAGRGCAAGGPDQGVPAGDACGPAAQEPVRGAQCRHGLRGRRGERRLLRRRQPQPAARDQRHRRRPGAPRARGVGERRGRARVGRRLREDVSRQRPHDPRALGLQEPIAANTARSSPTGLPSRFPARRRAWTN